ncbi:MAG: FAD-binding oxidoreductase [Ferruginibacter sp.]|nr:FAD-binding oxidoreductase [Ferruginibacter sp.]
MKPSLYFAADEKDVDQLKAEYTIRKKFGFKMDYLSASAVKKKYHFEAPGAILSQLGGQTNAYLLAHCLLQYCKGRGVQIFDHTPANSIRHTAKDVTVTVSRGVKITAKKLVYATGYEAVNFIDKKIVKLESTYACISEQANEKTRFWKEEALMWNTAQPYFYMRTTDDNRMLIGGRDSKFYDPVRRDRLLKQKIRDLVKDFNKIFPAIEFKPEFSWAGTFGSTEDGLPFIGEFPKLPNSLFALGFGGNGITFSLIAAEMITALVTGKPSKDASIFSFDRV